MKLEDVRNIAKSRGDHPGMFSKTGLIKTLHVEAGTALALLPVRASRLQDRFETTRQGELV